MTTLLGLPGPHLHRLSNTLTVLVSHIVLMDEAYAQGADVTPDLRALQEVAEETMRDLQDVMACTVPQHPLSVHGGADTLGMALLVSSDPADARAAQGFAAQGITTLLATVPAAALALLSWLTQRPDVLVVDAALPLLGATQLIGQARSYFPDLPAILVWNSPTPPPPALPQTCAVVRPLTASRLRASSATLLARSHGSDGRGQNP